MIVDVVEVDGGLRWGEVLEVVAEEWCVGGKLVNEFHEVILFDALGVAG